MDSFYLETAVVENHELHVMTVVNGYNKILEAKHEQLKRALASCVFILFVMLSFNKIKQLYHADVQGFSARMFHNIIIIFFCKEKTLNCAHEIGRSLRNIYLQQQFSLPNPYQIFHHL